MVRSLLRRYGKSHRRRASSTPKPCTSSNSRRRSPKRRTHHRILKSLRSSRSQGPIDAESSAFSDRVCKPLATTSIWSGVANPAIPRGYRQIEHKVACTRQAQRRQQRGSRSRFPTAPCETHASMIFGSFRRFGRTRPITRRSHGPTATSRAGARRPAGPIWSN